jgi:hypothetical protein
VIGPVVIGLLPLLACGTAIFFVARFLGGAVVGGMTRQAVATELPRTLHGLWQLLRDQITLAENALDAALAADAGQWQVWLFLYLVICLTIRMAPFPGTMRGSLGAIALLGVGAWILSMIAGATEATILRGWPVMSLSTATLTLLLLLSLAVRGCVGLARLLAANR